MKKEELIRKISEKAGVSQKNTAVTLKAFIEVVTETVSKEEKVQLIGFGTFEARRRAARKGVNPLTGKKISIPAGKRPVFSAGKAFKEIVKGK